MLRENNCQLGILYTVKLSFKSEDEIKRYAIDSTTKNYMEPKNNSNKEIEKLLWRKL